MKFPDDDTPLGYWLRILNGPLYVVHQSAPPIGAVESHRRIPEHCLPRLCFVGVHLPPSWDTGFGVGFRIIVNESLLLPPHKWSRAASLRLVLWGARGRPSSACIRLNAWNRDAKPRVPLHCPAAIPFRRPQSPERSASDAVLVMLRATVRREDIYEAGSGLPPLAILGPCMLVPIQWFGCLRVPAVLSPMVDNNEILTRWLAHLSGDTRRIKGGKWRQEVAVDAAEEAAERSADVDPLTVDIGRALVDCVKCPIRAGSARARANSLRPVSKRDGGRLLSPSVASALSISPEH